MTTLNKLVTDLTCLQGPFAVPAAFAGTDLVTFTLVAMENEADPRSLQVALQCVEVCQLTWAVYSWCLKVYCTAMGAGFGKVFLFKGALHFGTVSKTATVLCWKSWSFPGPSALGAIHLQVTGVGIVGCL